MSPNMGIIKLFLVFFFLQICSADYKECKWVRTFACGGEFLSCIGRIRLGKNAHSSKEAEIVEKQVQEQLKLWGQKIIGTIEKYTGECSFDPKQSPSAQGQKLCCDFSF